MMSSFRSRLRGAALVGVLVLVVVPTAGCFVDDPAANGFVGFQLVAQGQVQAGQPTVVLVLAQGSASSPFSSYTGTVQLDVGDPQVPGPTSYTFTAADAGAHAFNVVWKTAGTRRIQVSDGTGKATGTGSVEVSAGAPVQLVVVSGDAQQGPGGKALSQPFVARVADAYGNGVGNSAVTWAVTGGDGTVTPTAAASLTAADGTSTATATLGAAQRTNTFTATAQSFAPVTFTATRSAYRLVYTDPTAGVVRLARNAASTDSVVVLDFAVSQAPAGAVYAAGFNLPLDATRVTLDLKSPFTLPATLALDPGTAPRAALAVLPTSGPLAGNLVTVLSQKAAGAGAVAIDAKVLVGAVLYSVTLDLQPDAPPGVVFDGGKNPLVSGGLRNKAGEAVVAAMNVGIGKLEIVP